MAGMTVTLAGQDISLFVEEMSLDIHDTLGQGAGVGGGSSGRATTCSFLTRLGPAMSAVGAGTVIDIQPLVTAIRQDSPLVYYPLTDVAGSTNVDDVSGFNRDATASGSPTFGSTALIACEPQDTSVDVSNGSYIEIPISALPSGAGPVTLEAFYYPTGNAPNGKYAGIISLGDAIGNHDFSVLHGNGGDSWVGSWGHGSTGAGRFSTLRTLYHVVAILDSGTCYLYVNGVLRNTTAMPDTITAYKCYIGKIAASTSALDSNFTPLPGKVGHVAVYSGHLSLTRIQAHYNQAIATYSPQLVRQGELIITDATGDKVFGGYATAYEDVTEYKTNYTKVDCHDYWQHLDRITVNEVYDGQTDIYMIRDLLSKYATWIDTTQLPTTASYTFGPENYQHFSLQKALQRIADKTGYSIWIDPDKKIHYLNPVQASTAPFALSDQPDFSTSFQMGVNSVTIDDNSAINRVYFYGGKHLSDDLTQDLTQLVNGTNDIFTLSYYPHKAADGKYHIIINGVDHQVTGFAGGTTNADKLIKDGGSASYILDIDAHVIYFNSAPTVGTTVKFKYRHEIPLVVVLTDETSYSFYGTYLDGVISDQTIFDTATAVKRCRTLLLEQAFGLTHLEVKTWKAGIQSGMILRIDHAVRAIHDSYIVQEVHIVPKGGGFFEYVITCGAWNWNLVDIVAQLARDATPEDTSSSEETVPIVVKQPTESVGVHDAWTKQTRTMGQYYARAVALGDGHDAYAGLCSSA